MSRASASSDTWLISKAVGYFANSPGVTIFTRTSVDCAERIVATRSSNGVWKFNPEPISP